MSEFYSRIESLAARSRAAERQALTEEATKTAMVLPFLQTLGFDVFNLDEVTPEFVSDVGTKKGEKVDFAVRIDGKVAMLIEAKPISTRLGETQYTQLFRYFHATEARLAILINGREAWFFSDTEEPNKMDREPFFRFNFQSFDKAKVDELARFQKHRFEIGTIIEAASNLKYIRGAAEYLKRQLSEPEEDFLRLIGRRIHDGMLTKSVLEQVRPAVQAALDEVIRERIQDSLNITLRGNPPPEVATVSVEVPAEDPPQGKDIQTTPDEIEGFMIIRAITAKVTPVERITMRDAKSYCAILLDDNNRRPVCRLYFNSPTTKYVGLFGPDKTEARHRIDKPSDLYRFVREIEETVSDYIA